MAMQYQWRISINVCSINRRKAIAKQSSWRKLPPESMASGEIILSGGVIWLVTWLWRKWRKQINLSCQSANGLSMAAAKCNAAQYKQCNIQ